MRKIQNLRGENPFSSPNTKLNKNSVNKEIHFHGQFLVNTHTIYTPATKLRRGIPFLATVLILMEFYLV